MSGTARVLIVDDEAAARAKVRRFLAAHQDCLVVGEAENGRQARELLNAEPVDLVFLDINMPELDGFAVLEGLARPPHVIFATAYSDSAVRAFDVHAVDYLLKPFDRGRFDHALARARQRMSQVRQQQDQAAVMAVLAGLSRRPAHAVRLLVGEQGRTTVVPVDELVWLESAANYVVLHRGRERLIMRTTLADLEARLDPDRFCRVHRQHLVNVERIVEIQPWAKGDLVLVLDNGEQVRASRRYRERLEQLL